VKRLPLIVALPSILAAAGIAWWGIVALLTGCSAAPPAASIPPDRNPLLALESRPLSQVEDVLDRGTAGILSRAFLPTEEEYAGFRVLEAKSPCLTRKPMASAWVSTKQRPLVGKEWVGTFSTSVSNTPAPPDQHCFVLMSTQEPGPGIELSPIQMPGCWLLIRPDHIIHVPPGYGGDAFLSRQEGSGRITMRWTPTSDFIGSRLWIQLMVADIGFNRAGAIMSAQALELVVGNK
jgi:hypothetical protein